MDDKAGKAPIEGRAQAEGRKEPVSYTVEVRRGEPPPKRIAAVRFGMAEGKEVAKGAALEVHEKTLYQLPERKPVEGGILDPKMGTTDRRGECTTCYGKLSDCAGHFGYVSLDLPVFHIGYFRGMLTVLQCICKWCARVMLSTEERMPLLRKMRSGKGQQESLQRKALFRKVCEKCKKKRECPHCRLPNGSVRKLPGSLKVVHDAYGQKVNEHGREKYLAELEEAARQNGELRQNMGSVQDDLNPMRVLTLLQRVNEEDMELLDLRERPESMVLTRLPVPPVCIRPSVEMDSGSGSNEDDITMKLVQIVEVNNMVRQGMQKGLPITNLMENWDSLQVQCAMYINSDLPGLPSSLHSPGKPLRGFVQRLKGKQGRFRGNLSGKRVDFSGRTVISPDPDLSIEEVGVPEHLALTLTFPERVSEQNLERLRQRVRNGLARHPGANFVLHGSGGRQYLKYGDRRRVAAELKSGDVVERHLHDGDVILFNRQPSLHRVSVMAHKVRVMPWRTLRLNECVCSPYNADFDGDEMNLHVPQTEEARVEALELMGVRNNLRTPKGGEMLVAATQDFLTTSYLISRKDSFFTRREIAQMACQMGDALLRFRLPTPCIIRPVELWSGKQVISILVRPSPCSRTALTMEAAEKWHLRGTGSMCPNDGYVVFRNGELLAGALGKACLDAGKTSIFFHLQLQQGARAASVAMGRLAKLSSRWLASRGFSIGLDDVRPSNDLANAKDATIRQGYAECDERIRQFERGELEPQAGCTASETLEASLTGRLSQIRENVGKECLNRLPRHNAPHIMATCGAKGSPINIAQMVACVGQQAVGGGRIEEGFHGRTLPHFGKGDRKPAAKGFVAASFYSGMGPTEFFFHTMAGREGLVDTAVKTAETGYMSRRLMKALEDLCIRYDATVRNAADHVVQFRYGDDGLDPIEMECKDGSPVDLDQAVAFAQLKHPRRPQALRERSESEEEVMRAFHRAGENGSLPPPLSAKPAAFKEAVEKRAKDEATKGATSNELEEMAMEARRRHWRKEVAPGTAVGAIGAQAIGEPGTQMTLKTFHFAGVASMNITQGVPRLKEVINAARSIATPVVTAELNNPLSSEDAKRAKAKLERTTAGQVCSRIAAVFKGKGGSCVELHLDRREATALGLPHLSSMSVAEELRRSPRLRSKQAYIWPVGDRVEVRPPDALKRSKLFWLESVRTLVKDIPVAGSDKVSRAIVNDKGGGTYNLFLEGRGLQGVLAIDEIDFTNTSSNHVMDVAAVLGIEAARTSIINEVETTMGAHGMSIDSRHTALLADTMTYKGEVLGITRHGLARMKESTLMLASFEKTTDHLFEAALHGRTDPVSGVSECIIMGAPCPLGTGSLSLRHSAPKSSSSARRPAPLLYR